MRGARGFTLIELVIVMVISALVAEIVFSLMQDQRDQIAAYDRGLRWSADARAALTTLARDARHATGVQVGEAHLTLRGDPAVAYALEDGALVRRTAGGRTVLATEVHAFRVARAAQRLDVELDFAFGRRDRHRAATHATTVALPRVQAPGRGPASK